MKKITFYCLSACLIALSCSKGDDPAPATGEKYMKLTAGSTWNYELINNSAPTSTTFYTVTSTNRDSTVNGRVYHVFTNSTNGPSEYYNITGSDYYTLRTMPAVLGGASKEILYLKDNVSVGGASWQAVKVDVASPLGTIQIILTNAITAKGFTKVVNGITYNDVIQVTTTISTIPTLPPGSFTTDIQAFYAPRYGMIQSINKINSTLTSPATNIDQLTNLKTATIL